MICPPWLFSLQHTEQFWAVSVVHSLPGTRFVQTGCMQTEFTHMPPPAPHAAVPVPPHSHVSQSFGPPSHSSKHCG